MSWVGTLFSVFNIPMWHILTFCKVTSGAAAHVGKASPKPGTRPYGYRGEISPGGEGEMRGVTIPCGLVAGGPFAEGASRCQWAKWGCLHEHLSIRRNRDKEQPANFTLHNVGRSPSQAPCYHWSRLDLNKLDGSETLCPIISPKRLPAPNYVYFSYLVLTCKICTHFSLCLEKKSKRNTWHIVQIYKGKRQLIRFIYIGRAES